MTTIESICTLTLTFGKRNKIIKVPRSIPTGQFKEKAAQKFAIAQPFTLECYKEDSRDWIEYDEDFELPVSGRARIILEELQVSQVCLSWYQYLQCLHLD